MNSKHIILVVLFLFFGGILGCDKINAKSFNKAQPSQVAKESLVVKGPFVAKVNNIPISLEDFNQEVGAYNAAVPQDRQEFKLTSRDKKIDYLKNEMVRRILLYQAAQDRGLNRSVDVLRALEKTKMDLLVLELIKQEADKISVTSKEIEDYYNTYKEQLKEPEEKDIREIVLSTEQEAKDILVQLLQGGDFAALAKERSKSKSAKNGGDLGFVQNDLIAKETASIANNLEAGQLSSVFKGAEGYYIIKIEAKRGGKQKTLTEMWEDIKKGLTFMKQQQQIDDLIGKLSRQAKIEIYEGEIK